MHWGYRSYFKLLEDVEELNKLGINILKTWGNVMKLSRIFAMNTYETIVPLYLIL